MITEREDKERDWANSEFMVFKKFLHTCVQIVNMTSKGPEESYLT